MATKEHFSTPKDCEFCDKQPYSLCDSCNLEVSKLTLYDFGTALQNALYCHGEPYCQEHAIGDLRAEAHLFNDDERDLQLKRLQRKIVGLNVIMGDVVDEISGLLGINIRQEWIDSIPDVGPDKTA